jgi:hypothetical protein
MKKKTQMKHQKVQKKLYLTKRPKNVREEYPHKYKPYQT